MDAGLNNHLKKISSELFIKFDSEERAKINKSIDNVVGKLEDYFNDEINEIIIFGSYTRDTILPRELDDNSDIDILIQFNTKDYDKLKPESYRTQIKKFAEKKFPKSVVVKDHPSIVIELLHIKFDLVPSIFDDGIFYDSIEIPNKDGGWMETEPESFNESLTKVNTKYSSIVKPIIRLLKYWNASHSYPYQSYELEKYIASMDFNGDNYESGFFYAVKNLPTRNLPAWAQSHVNNLKSNSKQIKEYIGDQNIKKAKGLLDKILPGFN